MMSFKDWLKENATTTSCVANFSQPVGGMIRKKKIKPIVWGKQPKNTKSLLINGGGAL